LNDAFQFLMQTVEWCLDTNGALLFSLMNNVLDWSRPVLHC